MTVDQIEPEPLSVPIRGGLDTPSRLGDHLPGMWGAAMDVGEWLRGLDLGQYEARFRDNNVDAVLLPRLTADDLKDIGVSAVGDRRRLLDAIAALAPAVNAPAETPRPRESAPPRNPRIPAERRQITVMFADLVDSTGLAARLDAEDLKDVIATFQRAVAEEVRRFGGHVAKPLGDGLLIYFGWPRAHEDDAERAARSAIAVVAAVRQLSSTDGAALATRIGLATGEVVVGDFADAGVDEEGAVVGESANLAARLQGIAEANSVVVSDQTSKLLGRQFAFSSLGEQRLKGFASPIKVWRIDSERESESRFEATRDGRFGPFVGREHEMGLLLQRWDEAKEGECQLALISGEAGIGKSRMVSEFVERLEGDVRRIAIQASALHTNTALYPVVRRLELRAGFRTEDNAAEKWQKLAAALPIRSPRRDTGLRFLARLLSLEPPQENTDQETPSVAEQREAALDLLAQTAESEADLAPLVIVVEDAHWIDATTIELIERILDRLRMRRAMALITYRPEFEPRWKQNANVAMLVLSRLRRRDAKAIFSALSAGRHLPPELAEQILAKSDGVPLFVEELTSAAFEVAQGSDSKIQIPPTLRDSLSERLDRLGPAKEVAQVASAFGREFSALLVAATLGRSEGELEDALDQLASIDVVFQSSRVARRFTFKHALLQEAAYESMLRSRRREVHSRIAQTLMRIRPELAETEPEVLATHLARAGDPAGAAEFWRRAGRLAQKNSAYREAIVAFKNTLPLMSERETAASVDVNRAIASAYFAIGDYESTRKHLADAAALAENGDDEVMLAEIVMQQSHVLNMYGGDLEDAARFGRRALEIATRRDDEALAYGARFALGQTGWIGGDYAAAIQFLTANMPENVRDMARVRDFGTAGSLLIDSMAILGSTLAHCGKFEQALGILQGALEIPTQSAFDFTVVRYHLARSHLHRGDAELALPIARAALERATEAGGKFTLPWQEAMLGYAQVLLGDLDAGVQLLDRACEASKPMHVPYLTALSSVLLGEALVSRQPERAFDVAEAGLGIARANGFRAQEAELLRVKAAALVGVDRGAAEAAANEGLALARRIGLGPEEAHGFRTLGDISLAKGDGKRANEFHDLARAKYQSLGMTIWLKALS